MDSATCNGMAARAGRMHLQHVLQALHTLRRMYPPEHSLLKNLSLHIDVLLAANGKDRGKWSELGRQPMSKQV